MMGIDVSLFDVIPVEVHDVATVNLQPGKLATMPLKCNVVELFFLDIIGAFDFYNAPRFIFSRIKDINPTVEPVTGKTCLE
jgi:hypothetical protein